MPLNLVPNRRRRGRGNAENPDTSLLDHAIVRLLELHDALEDGTENCLTGWLNECIENGEMLDPVEVKDIIWRIFNEVNTIQADFASARQKITR